MSAAVHCAKCKIEWNNKEDMVPCSGICGALFHLKCASISTTVFNNLIKTPQLKYYCNECSGLNLVSVVKRLDDLTSLLTKFCESFAIFSDMMKSSITEQNIHKLHDNAVGLAKAGDPKPSNLIIYGQDQSKGNLQSVPGSTKKFLFVSRLHPSTTQEAVISHISDKTGIVDPSDIICYALIPKHRLISDLSFISFKIGVNADMFDKITDPTVWPVGIFVREFEYRPRLSMASGVLLPNPKND